MKKLLVVSILMNLFLGTGLALEGIVCFAQHKAIEHNVWLSKENDTEQYTEEKVAVIEVPHLEMLKKGDLK